PLLVVRELRAMIVGILLPLVRALLLLVGERRSPRAAARPVDVVVGALGLLGVLARRVRLRADVLDERSGVLLRDPVGVGALRLVEALDGLLGGRLGLGVLAVPEEGGGLHPELCDVGFDGLCGGRWRRLPACCADGLLRLLLVQP